MPSSELIKILRTGSHGLDPTVRFLVLDMCDRLERKMRDCELLAQRIVKQKWIPVTERLPDRNDMVIAFYPTMRGTSGEMQIHKAWAMSETCTHWMPLPELPKEVQE